MNADAFRHFYEYHFAENRKLWGYIASLTGNQFTQDMGYSRGSVRNQVIHLISADQGWFSALRGIENPDELDPAVVADRAVVRAHWDRVEGEMRGYLATLRDDMLFGHPFSEGEDKVLFLWQVLLHVANHGTDHRAQLLRQLNDFGVETVSQDYVFYIFDHLPKS